MWTRVWSREERERARDRRRGRFGVKKAVSCVERRVYKETEKREGSVCKGKKEKEKGRKCRGRGNE